MPNGVNLQYRLNKIFNLWKLRATVKTKASTVCEIQYARENAVIANIDEDIQRAMDIFNSAYSRFGLKLKVNLTQILHQPYPDNSDPQPPQTTVNRQPLVNVDHFTDLGSPLSTKANIESEIERRIQAADTVMGRLTEQDLSNNDTFPRTKSKV